MLTGINTIYEVIIKLWIFQWKCIICYVAEGEIKGFVLPSFSNLITETQKSEQRKITLCVRMFYHGIFVVAI